MKTFFKLAFLFVKVFWMFILSLQLIIDKNAMDVDGDFAQTLLKIFLTLVKMFTLLVRLLVST